VITADLVNHRIANTATLDEAIGRLKAIEGQDMWQVQQRAHIRMLLYLTGRTHEMLNDLTDEARGIVLDAAGADGKFGGLEMYKAQRGLEDAWARFFKGWQALFQSLRREAASIPPGSLALEHQRVLAGGEFAEAKSVHDYAFESQIQSVLDAADQRIYQDGLQLSQRIWRLDRASVGGIQQTLYGGVAQQKGAWDIAKLLEQFLGAGRDCPRWTRSRLRLTKKEIAAGVKTGLISGDACAGQGVAYNALRLARNELQIVHGLATDSAMAAMPWIERERINLSPSHPIEDVCDTVVRGGEKGDGVYAKGTISLPLHVQCLCFKTAVQMSRDDFVAQMRGWLNGSQPWPAMDQYAGVIGAEAGQGVSVSLANTLVLGALLKWATGGWNDLNMDGEN